MDNNEGLVDACNDAVAQQQSLSANELLHAQWYTRWLVVDQLQRGVASRSVILNQR